jgi:hypothetical protein
MKTVTDIKNFINSFNNACFKRYEYNEIDGQEYVFFQASTFAKNGIEKALNRTAENKGGNNYKVCLS